MNNKEFDDVKKDLNYLDAYNNPMVDLVVDILGIACPSLLTMKEILDIHVNDFQAKKRDQFMDIILSGNSRITSDKVQDVTFIMELAKTIDVINRLSQNDKVVYIANLFKNEFIKGEKYNVNRYEEYLYRLDYMSIKKIDILIDLYKYDEGNIKENHAEWYDFKKVASEKYTISMDEVVSIFNGLTRTGFCRSLNMLFPSEKDIENPFYVTEYFKEFIKLIVP